MQHVQAGLGRRWGRRRLFRLARWPGHHSNPAAAPQATAPTALLLLLPGSGLLLVGLVYLWVAGLMDYYRVPKMQLGQLGHWTKVSLGFTLATIGAFGCYYVAWRIAKRLVPARHRFALVGGVAAVLSSILAFTYPLLSDDLFYGIASARTFGCYAQNPFALAPARFPRDPFLPYAGWKDLTMPYGPLWVLISGTVARLSDHGLLATVLAFKALNVAMFLLVTALLARLLVQISPRTALAGLVLWAWNPLVLVEVASSAHNDIVMVALIVLACSFAASRRVTLALLALALAIAVKYVAILLAPFFALYFLRRHDTWRAGLRSLVPGTIAAAYVLVALYVPFWVGPRTLGPLGEAQHYYGSIAAAARYFLHYGNPALRDTALRVGALALYVCCYGWMLRRAGRTLVELFISAHSALLVCLLLWPFFMPWYTVWLVPLAALTGKRRLARQTIVLTGAALATYLCQFTLRPAFRQPVEFWSTLSAALVFGSLLVVALAPAVRMAVRRALAWRARAVRPVLGV